MTTADQLIAKGKVEGRDETIRAVLERLLVARFGPLPPAIRDRIACAPTEVADRWLMRFAMAEHLEQIFEA